MPIRAILFNISFYGVTAILSFALLFVLVLPRGATVWAAKFWGRISLFLTEHVCGIHVEVRGRENMVAPPAIFASKHQSALDTLILNALLPNPIYVLKKSLLLLPLYGLYLWRIGSVAIDRSAGAGALKQLVREAKARLDAGNSLIIFPEGTRTPPDAENPDYHPGVSALYNQLNVPVVPVALSSGVCWGRNALIKRQGTVIIEFLEPIQPGSMDRKAFMLELKSRIETRSKALVAESRALLKS